MVGEDDDKENDERRTGENSLVLGVGSDPQTLMAKIVSDEEVSVNFIARQPWRLWQNSQGALLS